MSQQVSGVSNRINRPDTQVSPVGDAAETGKESDEKPIRRHELPHRQPEQKRYRTPQYRSAPDHNQWMRIKRQIRAGNPEWMKFNPLDNASR